MQVEGEELEYYTPPMAEAPLPQGEAPRSASSGSSSGHLVPIEEGVMGGSATEVPGLRPVAWMVES